jgi:hypothetical protein
MEHSMVQINIREMNVIFDRCPVDMLAYIQATNESDNSTIRTLYQRVKKAVQQIDLMVFVPIEEPDAIGCPESDLPGLRKKVNEILRDWIGDFGIDVIEVSGSPSERCSQVMKHMAAIQ